MRRAFRLFVVVIIILHVAPAADVLAQMSSGSFNVLSDTLGSEGGTETSASFILNDTLGGFGSGTQMISSSFILGAGFQTQSMEPVFTFSVGNAAVALTPNPTTALISTGSTSVTTSTNSLFGYATTVSENNNLQSGTFDIDDVADGAVGPAGVEEYGIALAGADRAFTDERSILSTSRTIASRTTFASGLGTTVTFKVSIDGTTRNGDYSHIVTFISTPNY